MESVTCPYDDTPSRVGGQMNISAYEALRRDTAEILNGFAWLNVSYLQMHPDNAGTVRALYDISYVGITLPQVLFHRAKHPVAPAGALPSFIAAIFKASRGVFSVAVDLLNKEGETKQVTAAEVVAFAESNGNLIRSETNRACAAPTKLIERTLVVMLTGHGGDPARSTLPKFVDFEKLWHFHVMQDEFSSALNDYSHFVQRLAGRGGSENADVLPADGAPAAFASATQRMLAEANAAQASLNRALGRSEVAPEIKAEALMRML